MFDLDLIKKVYAELPEKVNQAKAMLNRPMTYAEKILYAHLFETQKLQGFTSIQGKHAQPFLLPYTATI